MKNIISLVLFLFVIQNLYSQQSDIPCFYKNDSSYLILNKDSAEFRMYNIKYGKRYIKGKGTYYIKDSVIYIKTAPAEDNNYPRFEDVGQSELKEKLLVDVFNENNTRVSRFIYEIIGVKQRKKYDYNRYREVCENDICEINLNTVKEPEYISICVSEVSLATERRQEYFSMHIKIPVKSIKTDKINIYLTPDKFVYDTLVRFELGKDEQGIFVFGPKGIYPPDEPKKTKFYFLTGRLLLPTTSNSKQKMESVIYEKK